MSIVISIASCVIGIITVLAAGIILFWFMFALVTVTLLASHTAKTLIDAMHSPDWEQRWRDMMPPLNKRQAK